MRVQRGVWWKWNNESEKKSESEIVHLTYMMRVWMRRVGCLIMSRKLPPAAAALGFVRTICQRLCQENISSEQSTKDRFFKSCVHENWIFSKSDLLWLDRLSIHLAGLGKDLLGILHATPDWRRDSIGPTLCLPRFLGFNHLTLQPSSSSSSSYFAINHLGDSGSQKRRTAPTATMAEMI